MSGGLLQIPLTRTCNKNREKTQTKNAAPRGGERRVPRKSQNEVWDLWGRFGFHFWLPNAYAFAPSVVTTFLAATATKVSIYLLMRYFYTVFGFSFGMSSELIIGIILSCSILAIFVGSFSAIFENNLKRLLAFSSVAQIGYITLGIAIANNAGLTGSMVHIFNHALMKASLFMILGAIAFQIHKY